MQSNHKVSGPQPWIRFNDHFRHDFNRQSFKLLHGLADHPLFALPRLLELARVTRETRPRDLYYDAGKDVRVDQRWDQIGPKPFLVEEALHQIEHAGAWVTLHQAQKDAAYGLLFNECMREFEQLTAVPFRRLMKIEDALIFITSPNRVTPYHIDRECNFLLQIRGEKTIYVFDQNDREVLPEQEIECFWAVDNNAAKYKPELQSRAISYRLTPGSGIHIPVNAPHWVKNDNNISVSLSVNFTFKDTERSNIYTANHFLRKMGVRPQPPGQSRVGDSLKNAVGALALVPGRAMARSAIRFVRRVKRGGLWRDYKVCDFD